MPGSSGVFDEAGNPLIRSAHATDEYREGWDRIFGKGGRETGEISHPDLCPVKDCKTCEEMRDGRD